MDSTHSVSSSVPDLEHHYPPGRCNESGSSNSTASNRISADLERRCPAGTKITSYGALSGRESADMTSYFSSTSPIIGSRPAPPTPPGSPVDRPFPAATLPLPPGTKPSTSRRGVGDGSGRRGKSETRLPGAAAAPHSGGKSHRRKAKSSTAATDDDLVRQPSDGYQVLDDDAKAATRHQRHDSGHSAASTDTNDSSSECDWSEDDGDSSEEEVNSEDETRAPREAADGMSSETETECLI